MKPICSLVFLIFMMYAIPTQAGIDSLRHKFKYSLEVMNFGLGTKYADEIGTINPNNRVADLNKFSAGSYFRPSFSYRATKERTFFRLKVKPRLNIEEDGGFFFQELKAQVDIYDNLYVLGGRFLKEIGTATLISPSNPYVNNSGVLNPKFELKPMDFLELNYTTGYWTFSFIANLNEVDSPIFQEPLFEFSRNYGVFIERFGESDNSGLILMLDENKRFHLGAYKHQSVNEALLLWADFSLSSNINRFYPVAGHWTDPQLLEYDMISGKENENLFLTGLVGASYTFDFGPTLIVEYLYNQKGYNDEEFDLFNDMIASSSRYNFDITRDLANVNLGRAINTGMPFIRRNYIFAQLGQNDVWEKLNFNFRFLMSMDDPSAQASILLEYTNVEILEYFLLVAQNFGDRQSDLKRLINYQIMFGVTHKF